MKVEKTHKGYTETFRELNFEEQAKAISMTALQFRKQVRAHMDRAAEEGKDVKQVVDARLGLLRKILEDLEPLVL
jgi:hypothetical protein